MKVTMSLTTATTTAGEKKTRSLGNINKNYIFFGISGGPPIFPYPNATGAAGRETYSSLAQWIDSAGRALASLSLNAYDDSGVTANWSMVEELAG